MRPRKEVQLSGVHLSWVSFAVLLFHYSPRHFQHSNNHIIHIDKLLGITVITATHPLFTDAVRPDSLPCFVYVVLLLFSRLFPALLAILRTIISPFDSLQKSFIMPQTGFIVRIWTAKPRRQERLSPPPPFRQ